MDEQVIWLSVWMNGWMEDKNGHMNVVTNRQMNR